MKRRKSESELKSFVVSTKVTRDVHSWLKSKSKKHNVTVSRIVDAILCHWKHIGDQMGDKKGDYL